VTSFRVAWWRKDIPDLQAAYSGLKRAKVGRMARLRGDVETMENVAVSGVDDGIGKMSDAVAS
jgi:hypothetical protein